MTHPYSHAQKVVHAYNSVHPNSGVLTLLDQYLDGLLGTHRDFGLNQCKCLYTIKNLKIVSEIIPEFEYRSFVR
jgi:hypothetical protein